MILECGKFEEVGLEARMPRKIQPKIIVYDISNRMTEGYILKELYSKNLKECVTEEEFRRGRVRIISRSNKKGAEQGNVILEVTAGIKRSLSERMRIFIEWGAHRVRHYINVLRCYKCLVFGHTLRECSSKERLCHRCGEEGHLAKDCKSESKCRNCRIRGREHSHSVMSAECPEFLRVYERERMRVENG